MSRPQVDRSYPEKWRAERLKEINGEDGWTSLVGLFWLTEGQNRFGSDHSNEIVLPQERAARFAGSLWLQRGAVRLDAKLEAGIMYDGSPAGKLVLRSDVEGEPTKLKLGSLTLFIIKRGERIGLRVKDKHNPARPHFSGLAYFPVDAKSRIEAKFLPYNPPKTIPIVNVLGMIEEMTSPGAVVFEMNGKTFRLDPVLESGSNQHFIMLADQTTGKETYSAGRYLYVDPPGATEPARAARRSGERKYAGAGH